jgi:hypothetical protein
MSKKIQRATGFVAVALAAVGITWASMGQSADVELSGPQTVGQIILNKESDLDKDNDLNKQSDLDKNNDLNKQSDLDKHGDLGIGNL